MPQIKLKNTSIVFLAAVLFWLAPAKAQDSSYTMEVSQGISYHRLIEKNERLVVNILKINLKSEDYRVEAVKAHDLLDSRETTSEMCRRISDEGSSVIAGINADYWDSKGEIINNMVDNRIIVKAVEGHADDKLNRLFTQLALTENNKPLMGKFDFNGMIILKDGIKEKINRINSKTDSASITLYNHYQGKNTPEEKSGLRVFETKLRPAGNSGDTLIFVLKNDPVAGGNSPIIRNGFVLSYSGRMAGLLNPQLKEGDTVKVLLSFVPREGKIFTLTGGLPQIVKNGINLAAFSDTLDGLSRSFTVTKHPRTGVGFSKDSTFLFFITVDGRQESSSGMSLREFANLMISQGVYQGLNLDGGGSTTMVIDGKVVNHPSDPTGERPVGSCLLVVKRDKDEKNNNSR